MSSFAVNKICRRVYQDAAFRAALDSAPQAALAPFGLTDEESRLLLAGEVGRLYELGAHPFLLAHLTRHATFGVTVDKFSDRMIAARDDRASPLEPAAYYRAQAASLKTGS